MSGAIIGSPYKPYCNLLPAGGPIRETACALRVPCITFLLLNSIRYQCSEYPAFESDHPFCLVRSPYFHHVRSALGSSLDSVHCSSASRILRVRWYEYQCTLTSSCEHMNFVPKCPHDPSVRSPQKQVNHHQRPRHCCKLPRRLMRAQQIWHAPTKATWTR